MSYTVKELAKLSGVSVRTLHWYDEIGLLRPAYVGSNGYRYYEKEELLLLQQIFFYRKLGFPLKEIQKLLAGNSFDKIHALLTHREFLMKQIDRSKELIETIDKTINHIKGKIQMKDEELYAGFDAAKQGEYEQYLVKYHGTIAQGVFIKKSLHSYNF